MSVEIKLTETDSLRRELLVNLCGFYIAVSAYAPPQRMIAYTSVPKSNARLVRKDGDFALWIGSVAFDLTAEEFVRLEDVLTPHGITIDKRQP